MENQGIRDARTLGVPKMLILGLQHMFAMFGATVLVPALTPPCSLQAWARCCFTFWPRERCLLSWAVRSLSWRAMRPSRPMEKRSFSRMPV